MKDDASTDELSALFGCSPQTVRELARRGVIGKSGKTFPVAESFRRYAAHLRAGAAARAGPESIAVSVERAGLLRTQRQRAEFEFAKERKEFIPLSEVKEISDTVIRGCRMAIMAVADRIAPSLGLNREAYVALKEEMMVILTDVAKQGNDWFGNDEELKRLEENMNHDDA